MKKSTKKIDSVAANSIPPVEDWKTIHIFGDGETQLISSAFNRKVRTSELTTLPALLEHLVSMQQKGTKVSLKNLHAINIFNGLFISFIPKNQNNVPQRFGWEEVDLKLIQKVHKELSALPELNFPLDLVIPDNSGAVKIPKANAHAKKNQRDKRVSSKK